LRATASRANPHAGAPAPRFGPKTFRTRHEHKRAGRAPTRLPTARETIRAALGGSRLGRRSHGSGPACREHPSPLKRLPHKAKRLPQEHDATVSQRPHLPSCLRNQAPSAPVGKRRKQTIDSRFALPTTTRNVGGQYPFPSPRCLEARACGRKRPEGGRPGWPAVFAEAGMPSRRPPPGRPGPPRRSHKTLSRAAALLSQGTT
jgi:hypothetical protein